MRFPNPFRPGAGHSPPHLAGRADERKEFGRLLQQRIILENPLLTGLRGVGKTVLLDSLKPTAIDAGWKWTGTDLSESACVSEDAMAIRIFTDLSPITSSLVLDRDEVRQVGFADTAPKEREIEYRLGFDTLMTIYEGTPGLPHDKLKTVLKLVCSSLKDTNAKGIIFAYDEAQNLADRADKDQYPLSLLLDVFQSLQKQKIPVMLALAGLPTLFPKLVEARTFSERMFRVLFLEGLSPAESREAIVRPLAGSPLQLGEPSIATIIETSSGYPYFIQFICREVFDAFIQRMGDGSDPSVPIKEIERKLDSDFFAGRFARATDRQRELLWVIAHLDCSEEFSVKQVVELSGRSLENGFSSSHANQMLSALCDRGLVYRNRHGRYSFAVPLLGGYIRRQPSPDGAKTRA